MIFRPQRYRLPDRPGEPFIDPEEIENLLVQKAGASAAEVEAVIGRAMARQRLSLSETAVLLGASADARERVLAAAERLKREVYGSRIVLFAPLYVGNRCTNRCAYCSFRADSADTVRKTLTDSEIVREVEALERVGHKRLILVYGEHPAYDPAYIARTVRTTYGVRTEPGGEIRRVNINAAPLSVEGFRTVREAGIGTYQIFQETYHRGAYGRYHLGGRKADYDWRLTSLDRAMEAGIDDVGLGALLGLHDWRFEVMGLVRHTNHLEACFGVGPHTISFPRIKESSASLPAASPVGDEDFVYAIAVLRLAVPYTGLILTAREPASVRDRAIRYGVSQIDGGTRLEIGSYSGEPAAEQGSSQFAIHDSRSLDEIVGRLVESGYLPSFCTACYRRGRTGEHFMEFSVPGFIKRFCGPNAILTLAEYLADYASPVVAERGWAAIDRAVAELPAEAAVQTRLRLERIRTGERDLYF
ncbi:MAG: [FeFe] hydrogenase H-cluster radical SAM maturase HydG [Rikenella sp.]|nr:[FeFe] hydrogenase H-cluster radical SAM maturase HydG [Rikenella sp.]